MKKTLCTIFILIVCSGVSFRSYAQVGPAGVNTGIVTWLDASDVDGDGILNDQPADGATVATWIDKSGNGKNATTLSGQQSPTLQSDPSSLMEGNPVLYFPGNAVYVFSGIDLRASALPNATIFTVYRNTAGAGTTTGLWGVDNADWDRFIYTRFGSATDGIASQGPVNPVYVVIPGSGTQDKIQLFTASFVHNVAGASAFYLGGKLVGTFHDRSDLTNAQANFRLGWDGDGGHFYGHIAELIVYNRKLTDCEILTVNKFLSVKYNQDFNNLSSNYNWPAPYTSDIAVIGTKGDACGSTVYNEATSSLFTILNPTSNNTVGEYLSISHNSGAITSSTSEMLSDHRRRTAREWRVDEDGDLGNVDVCIDVTGVGFAGTQASAYSLFSDADGDFSNATVLATGSTMSGNVVCFTGVNLQHGLYYTIAEKNVAPVITTPAVNLPAIFEDIPTASNTGTTVSALIAGAITDGNNDAAGIAVVSRDVANGKWQYFTAGLWSDLDLIGVASATQAVLLPPTAQIRFAPAAGYFGSATFVFRAWDQVSGTAYSTANTTTNGGATAFSSATGTASVVINAVNVAPTITSTPVTSVNEDAAYSYTIVATDTDAGDVLTYSAPVLPAWLTFNTTTKILSGTPTNAQVGIHNVTLRVNDAVVNVDQSFSITVTNVNDAPTVTSSAITSVNEDAAYSYTITATDVDAGNVLSYSAPVLPVWMTFNTTTKLLSGTPTNNEVGTHSVTLRVNDGTVNVDQVFSILVTNTNDAPLISSVPPTTVSEDILYTYTFVSSDVDAGNVLVYSAPVLPSWLNFNSTTKVLSGTPGNSEVGIHAVTLRVNDGTVNADQIFSITVTNTNDAPTITSVAITSVNEDVGYVYTIDASDIDVGNVLSYSAPVLPSWLTFNPATRVLSGTPTNSEVGLNNVTLRVSDGTVDVDQVFVITVVNTNDAPAITSSPVASVNEDGSYSYTIVATDVDAGNVLIFSAPVLPGWLTFNPTTFLLSGIPTNAEVGIHSVTIRVNDGTVNTDQAFTVTVINTNDAPTVTSTEVTSVNEDAAYSYTVIASDVDAGNVLTFSAPVLPSWLTFNTTTRLLSGTPANSEVGPHPVTLRVNDGTVNVDQVFSIMVVNTNDAPTITSVTVTSVNEDAAYSYTIAALDVDAGNVLSYSAPVLPSWLTFNTTTKLLSGTPSNNDVGTHPVTLRVNDGTVNVDQVFSIVVANTNDAPTISSVAITSVNEDAAYSYTINASDVDAGNVLNYSAPVLPSWLTFNITTKLLSGTPSNNDVGTHAVTLRVNDGTVNVDQVFSIVVTNTNDSPTFSSTAVVSVNEDAAYSYTVGASDVDAGNILTFTAPVLPSWLTFNTTTKILSGTPTNNEVGSHSVTLRVNDGTVNVDQVFSIVVINTNDAPAISTVAITSVNEDTAYSYTIAAVDEDAGNVLTYLAPVLPSWLTFNATTKILSGTPTNNEVGSHPVTLRVSDGTVNVDQVFSIVVTNTNDAPTFSSTAVITVSEDAAYSYTVSASDVDAGNILTYTAPVLPSWLTFNTTTKILSGTPTNSEVGSHSVTLRVNDGTVNVDQAFSITVTDTNDSPVISSIAILSVNEDAAYSYTISASDPDAGNILTFSAQLLPGWLTFNATTKLLSGTPSNSDVGAHTVALRVNDGTISVDQSFTITVTNTNDGPLIESIGVTTANEDVLYSYTLVASDVDLGDALTYAATELPSWLTFNTTSHVLSGIPANNEVGEHSVTLSVSDGIITIDEVFKIKVENTNDNPVITSIPSASVDEDSPYTYTILASDMDVDDVLTFSAPVLPSWLVFNTATNTLYGMPSNDDVGIHNITLRVKDGTDGVDQEFTITIVNTNDTPVITSVPVSSAEEDDAYAYTITAMDADAGSTLTYTATVLPSWLSFNTTTQLLSGTPTNSDLGIHSITLQTDDGIIAIEQTFSINVLNANDEPVINSVAITTASEDAVYSYTFTATDIDAGDILTYSAPVLPTWLIFEPLTGLLSGTPVNENVGVHNITLRVNDGTKDIDQAFVITVSNTNDELVITSVPASSVNEDDSFTYTITAMDVDVSDILTFSAPVLPDWLSFDPISGLLSGTPTNGDVGTHDLKLTATDGTVSKDQVFTLTVSNVNDAPVISSAPVTSVNEDNTYTYELVSSDEDSDILTYSAPELPVWLIFNISTGVLSGVPTNDVVGGHGVTLRVNDGTVDVDQVFTITVTNTNDSPIISTTALTSVEEDTEYSYSFAAFDDDGNTLTYSAPVLPDWLTFNSITGVLSGMPTNNETGIYEVTLRVDDGTISVDQYFTITVNNANDAPTIAPIADSSIDEGEVYSYTIVASDMDDMDVIKYEAILPAWLTIDPETGLLTGTPSNNEVGIHNISVSAGDGTTVTEQSFTITVLNINDAPVITSAAVITASENFAYVYTITATDIDAGAELNYTSSLLPAWLSFDSTMGTLQGKPSGADIGTYEITLSVSDGMASASQVFTITVVPNIAPVVLAGQNFTVTEKSQEGTEIGVALGFDNDGNTLMNWTIVDGNPGNVFIIDPSTGMITVNNSGELDFDIHSGYTLLIAVGDGFSISLPVVVTITVNEVMEGLQFYSAFSPNGDGSNDTWEIDGLAAYPESHTKIFNADGMVMFSNIGYTERWDGFYKGKEMPLGTYYYIINLNDGTGKKLNGYFMIIK